MTKVPNTPTRTEKEDRKRRVSELRVYQDRLFRVYMKPLEW